MKVNFGCGRTSYWKAWNLKPVAGFSTPDARSGSPHTSSKIRLGLSGQLIQCLFST